MNGDFALIFRIIISVGVAYIRRYSSIGYYT